MLEKINHKSAPKEVVNALVTLYHEGKYDDVLSRSSQLIKEYPQTFVLHNIIGAISFEKGHKEIAIEHFRKVIKLRPHHPHAYNNLGATLIDIGEYQEAKSNLKKAIELQPDYAEAYNNLGNAYKEMEEYNEAILVYEKAIELNPQYYEAYNNLGAVLGKNEQYDEAIEAYNKTILLKPDFAEAYNNMGIALKEQGKLDKAIKSLENAISIKPDYAEGFINLELLKIQLSDFDFKVPGINNEKNSRLYYVLSKHPKYQIQKAISKFMFGEIRLCSQYLQKYDNLLKTKDSQKLVTKDKIFCNAYYYFLKSLIKNTTRLGYVNYPKIYHVGESHCLSYAHSEFCIAGKRHVIIPKIIFGAKSFHFSTSSENPYKAITKSHLKNIPRGSKVFISFGEIDCRANEGIIKYIYKTGKAINEIINDTVNGYIEWFLKHNIVGQHKFYFFNIPAPMYDSKFTQQTNNKVSKIIEIFNAVLSKKTSNTKTNIVDVYSHTIGEKGFSNGLYHCDNKHLDSRIIPLIECNLNH